jgi:hypothetical protein
MGQGLGIYGNPESTQRFHSNIPNTGTRVRTGGYNVVCVHGVFADMIALVHAYACMLSNGVLFERH